MEEHVRDSGGDSEEEVLCCGGNDVRPTRAESEREAFRQEGRAEEGVARKVRTSGGSWSW